MYKRQQLSTLTFSNLCLYGIAEVIKEEFEKLSLVDNLNFSGFTKTIQLIAEERASIGGLKLFPYQYGIKRILK